MTALDSAAGIFGFPFYAVISGRPAPATGMRIGHYVVRKGNLGEEGAVSGAPVEYALHYIPPGEVVAVHAAIVFAGPLALERALYVADEFSRHLVVDARGFETCARAWSGFDHLFAQGDPMSRGEAPVPWHHTEAYRRSLPTLSAEEAA